MYFISISSIIELKDITLDKPHQINVIDDVEKGLINFNSIIAQENRSFKTFNESYQLSKNRSSTVRTRGKTLSQNFLTYPIVTFFVGIFKEIRRGVFTVADTVETPLFCVQVGQPLNDYKLNVRSARANAINQALYIHDFPCLVSRGLGEDNHKGLVGLLVS